MDRDYSSGTALQEISFWLNLEKALQRIQEKRDSQEVTLTLDILKYAKRFHATVSFDSDTGELCYVFVTETLHGNCNFYSVMVMCRTGVIGRVDFDSTTCLSYSFCFADVHLNFINVSAAPLINNLVFEREPRMLMHFHQMGFGSSKMGFQGFLKGMKLFSKDS